jgi:HSP20 family molecular chaperone IbpA
MLFNNYASRLFDDFFEDSFKNFGFNSANGNAPHIMKTDILEKDGQYMIDIELPGYEKEDVEAELKDGYLTIKAQKKQTVETNDDKSNYIRKERYTGTCSRTFYVGDEVEEDSIKAGFKDGILRLVIAKPEVKIAENKRKLIPIQ